MLQQIVSTITPPVLAGPRSRPTGLVAGTLVRTTEGDVPVEFLLAGDRIVVHGGATAELRGTSVIDGRELDLVTISHAASHAAPHAAPGAGRRTRDLVIPASQQILVRDWRAMLIHGQEEMLTPASSLVDDHLVTRRTHDRTRLIRLHFDTPQVLWANGVEVASARSRAPSLASTRGPLLH